MPEGDVNNRRIKIHFARNITTRCKEDGKLSKRKQMQKEQNDVLIVRDFVRNTGGREFHFNEIVRGLNIVEYSGRISNVRAIHFGCTCGQNKKTCTAIEHIQNTRKCYYRYVCRKLAYEDEIKPSQIIRQEPVAPQKPEMNAEARARWEALRIKFSKPRLPVREYGTF